MRTPDRLARIAAQRGTDPDIVFLCQEVLRLRQQVAAEHDICLDLASIALTKLNTMREDVEALTEPSA